MHTSLLICNQFSHTSRAHDMQCISIMRKKYIAQLMTRKNVITALIIASTTQRYQAVDVVPIITYNVRGSHTNRSNVIRYSHFPQMLVFFQAFALNAFACHWMKWEHRKTISMSLCMCGLTLHCVHVWAGCIWGLCLSFVFLPQIEPDSYVQYPVKEHNSADKERRKSIKCFG